MLELSKYHINTPSSHIRYKLTKIDKGAKIKHFAKFRDNPNYRPSQFFEQDNHHNGKKVKHSCDNLSHTNIKYKVVTLFLMFAAFHRRELCATYPMLN